MQGYKYLHCYLQSTKGVRSSTEAESSCDVFEANKYRHDLRLISMGSNPRKTF